MTGPIEDAATCEISRSQLWQWLRHAVRLDDGRAFDRSLYESLRDEELARLRSSDQGHLDPAAAILDRLVLAPSIEPFMTLLAYPLLP